MNMNKTAKIALGVGGFLALIYAFKVIRSNWKRKKEQEAKDAAVNTGDTNTTPAYLRTASFPLQLNSKGSQVQVLQKWLGELDTDGYFGGMTLSRFMKITGGQTKLSKADYDKIVLTNKSHDITERYFTLGEAVV